METIRVILPFCLTALSILDPSGNAAQLTPAAVGDAAVSGFISGRSNLALASAGCFLLTAE